MDTCVIKDDVLNSTSNPHLKEQDYYVIRLSNSSTTLLNIYRPDTLPPSNTVFTISQQGNTFPADKYKQKTPPGNIMEIIDTAMHHATYANKDAEDDNEIAFPSIIDFIQHTLQNSAF